MPRNQGGYLQSGNGIQALTGSGLEKRRNSLPGQAWLTPGRTDRVVVIKSIWYWMTNQKDKVMHTTFLGTTLRCGALALLLMTATRAAWSQDKVMTMLFKVITVKDDIVIGLNTAELDNLC